MPGGPQAVFLADGRLHLQHGPIDLIIEAFGEPGEVRRAYAQARTGFEDVLERLVEELSELRRPVGEYYPELCGPVAMRMASAVWPHREVFITPMAAVAGAVADEMLSRMTAGRALRRAYVNDGGDIALYLSADEHFRTGLVSRLDRPAIDGVCIVHADMPVRGIATSGCSGRSFSLGIADAVTVLAKNAAHADAAATLIANAVNVEHPAILRKPARELDEDSDLGDLAVTVAVGNLPIETVRAALDAGVSRALSMQRKNLIYGAVLALKGQFRMVGKDFAFAELETNADYSLN